MSPLCGMPELPEVETIVRQLQQKIRGKTINSIDIRDKKVIDQKIKRYLPAKISSISRRGKTIIISLDNNKHLLTHLRMTGHFHHVTNKKDTKYKKYLAAKFNLEGKSFFTYNTIRRFGSVTLVNNTQLQAHSKKLGPEPLTISFKDFQDILTKYPTANIKSKLLDQSIIAGIGNIYVQEALYRAKINPLKIILQISTVKLQSLHKELLRVLYLGIKNNGASVDNYSNLDGKGNFQNLLQVYNQEKCPKKHALDKIEIAGRGTYYCKICQK